MTYMAYLLVLESEISFQEMTSKWMPRTPHSELESHLALSLFGS